MLFANAISAINVLAAIPEVEELLAFVLLGSQQAKTPIVLAGITLQLLTG